jgi:hypothetical protein
MRQFQIVNNISKPCAASWRKPKGPALLDELSDKHLEHQLAERATKWREVLAGDTPLARQALRALMAGPIWFSPLRNGYHLRGSTRLGALWPEDAELSTSVKMASPRGTVLNAVELPWE